MSGPPCVDLSRFGSALILKPSSLGDIVHALPAVHRIWKTFPRLKLRWLCNEEWAPLLEGHPALAEVIPFPRARFRGVRGLPALARWVSAFRRAPREEPEIALDFQGLIRTALLGVARGARPRVGMSPAREGAGWFYNHAVDTAPGAHAVDRCLALASGVGANRGTELEWPLPDGMAPDRPLPDRFVLMHPCARGSGKSLGVDALRALCDALAPRSVVVVGRSDPAPDIRGPNVLPLINETGIGELIWLVRRARFVISVDSGPMHIASALRPGQTLGIHTWSDPRRVGPYDARAWVWKAGRIAHRPDFTDEEAASDRGFTAGDARAVAEFVDRFHAA